MVICENETKSVKVKEVITVCVISTNEYFKQISSGEFELGISLCWEILTNS